jgi:hypothetical protein
MHLSVFNQFLRIGPSNMETFSRRAAPPHLSRGANFVPS